MEYKKKSQTILISSITCHDKGEGGVVEERFDA
jgi:hypothetical protein